MTSLDLVHLRLHNQRLASRPFERPEEVVHWLGAVQAQEYPGAVWGLAQRTNGLSQSAIDQAFAEGAILRTHAMRPTWHFVSPADIRWLLKLTSPRVHAANASYYRKLGLDTSIFVRGASLLSNALQGGKHLTRAELAILLQQAGVLGVDDGGMRLAYIMMYAELEGIICSGAMRGKQHTYALLEERVPPVRMLTRDESLAELVRRYFTSHGPATVKDFTWWSGLSTADAKLGLALNKGQLDSATIDEKIYWFVPGASIPTIDDPIAHLLPAYDEYTIAYKDHAVILDPQYRQRVIASFGIVIIIDGRIIGLWKRVLTKAAVVLTLNVFTTPNAAESMAITRIVEQYGAFLQRPVELSPMETV